MIKLEWVKTTDYQWANLERINLSGVKTTGVYIIWHGGSTPRAVRLGQGDIASRVGFHKNDSQILAYRNSGLYVTWATLPQAYLNGVERYLAETYHPLVGDRFPDVPAILVNLPV